MFYDKFHSLCQAKGVSKTKVAADIGFDRSNITKWKTKGFAPRGELLKKIAEYFGVSVDFLLGTEEAHTRTVSEEDIKFALFGENSEVTDKMYEEIKEFARFVKSKYGKE